MATITISLTNINPAASAVSVTNVIRSDTLAQPAGISLPIALTFIAPTWSATFTDTSPPPSYTTTATITEGGVTSIPFSWDFPSSASVAGYWTSQSAIESYIGGYNADLLSNLNNNQTGPSAAGFADAIMRAESRLNYELALFWYPNGTTTPPFPLTSMAGPSFQTDATMLASAWIYSKRGYDDSLKYLAGAFKKAEDDAMADIRRIIRNRIMDVPRSFKPQPIEMIVSPVIIPYWAGPNASQFLFPTPNQIPVIP